MSCFYTIEAFLIAAAKHETAWERILNIATGLFASAIDKRIGAWGVNFAASISGICLVFHAKPIITGVPSIRKAVFAPLFCMHKFVS
jgi:hypothetical protein